MTDLRTAARQALDALEWNLPVIEDYGNKEQLNRQHKALIALKAALTQSVRSVDHAMARSTRAGREHLKQEEPAAYITQPRYSPLTTEQALDLIDDVLEGGSTLYLVRAVEHRYNVKQTP